MTRGRTANTAHLVAGDVHDARDQWIAVFARDRADLGPAHAAALAATEAARHGPMAPARPVDQVLADFRAAWTAEETCLHRLAIWQPQRDTLRRAVALEAGHAGDLATLGAGVRQTADAAERATRRAEVGAAAIAADADRIRASLLAHWDGEREAARAAARVVLAGPALLGVRRTAVARAGEQLHGWADRWRPHLPHLPTDPTQLARVADWFDDRPALWTAFDDSARRAADHDHPEHAQLRATALAARQAHDQAQRALAEARRERDVRLALRAARLGVRPRSPARRPRARPRHHQPAADRHPSAHRPAGRRAGPARPAVRPGRPRARRLARPPRRRPRTRTDDGALAAESGPGGALSASRGPALPRLPARHGSQPPAVSQRHPGAQRPTPGR